MPTQSSKIELLTRVNVPYECLAILERHGALVKGIELRCTQDGHAFHATIFPKQHVNHNSPRQECFNTVFGLLIVLGLNRVPGEISHISRQVVLLATFLFIYLSPFQYS